MPLVEHQSSPLVLSAVRVTRSLVLCICSVDRCLSFCTFSVGHCVFCHSSIYGFWLPLWYLETLTMVSKYLILAFNGHLTKLCQSFKDNKIAHTFERFFYKFCLVFQHAIISCILVERYITVRNLHLILPVFSNNTFHTIG
jgi:hypothetical protein